jgi:hypothetical protein
MTKLLKDHLAVCPKHGVYLVRYVTCPGCAEEARRKKEGKL